MVLAVPKLLTYTAVKHPGFLYELRFLHRSVMRTGE
jgi:hypothetical protein